MTFRDVFENCRIIPARAGFTVSVQSNVSFLTDHPRSRGVYTFMIPSIVMHSGSSPLARGLRAVTTPSHVTTMDHPRSRGVYQRVLRRIEFMSGSSPLARGLPPAPGRMSRRPRIIPARAGFTFNVEYAQMKGRDHPRSRGVYFSPGASSTPLVGSSPLARGLRREILVVRPVPRIIPARAGFTA